MILLKYIYLYAFIVQVYWVLAVWASGMASSIMKKKKSSERNIISNGAT